MIRLHATVSKKMPVDGVDYASQQYGACIEVELASGADSIEVQACLDRLYRTLEETVDKQFGVCPPSGQVSGRSGSALDGGNGSRREGNGGNGNGGNGNGRRPRPSSQRSPSTEQGRSSKRQATNAQVRAVRAIAASLGIDDNKGLASYLEPFHVSKPEELSVKEASTVIGQLKAQQSTRKG